METPQHRNLADSLVEFLPTPAVLCEDAPNPDEPMGSVSHVGVPKGWQLQKLDNEHLLAHPRRTTAVATMGDDDSFVAYVLRHAKPGSLVWCEFNPVASRLHFTAVFDEHHDKPGWRAHRATFAPTLSPEWQKWNQYNKQSKSQLAFAEFIEQNEQDISNLDGYPTSLQMLTMATEFEARQDQRIKSTLRLQSGGIQLEYVADADKGTVERMKVFDKFVIGIPVFWSTPKAEAPIAAYQIKARLRYRMQEGRVTFYYDLIRPDLVHQAAALALVAKIRAGIGATPLLMGGCN